jgi:hypothetical protein
VRRITSCIISGAVFAIPCLAARCILNPSSVRARDAARLGNNLNHNDVKLSVFDGDGVDPGLSVTVNQVSKSGEKISHQTYGGKTSS